MTGADATAAQGKASTDRCAFRAPGTDGWQLLATDGDKHDEHAGPWKASGELRSTLLATLQMEHIVVLAGCGCSLSAGGPSMGDLWTGAVGRPATKAAALAASRVNHDLEKSQDIEALLSRVEASLQVAKDEALELFLNESRRVILEKCSTFLDSAKLDAHRVFLHRLSRRRVRDQRLRVFTTNYDLCFEAAASELGSVAMDGFSFTAPRRYDPRFFAYDIIRRSRSGEDLGNYLEGVFLLYKLHGSVNWAREAGGAVVQKDRPKAEEACLIYPAAGKYQQSFVEPHLESMSQYLTSLREPNTCVLVVGCGFNDDHIAEPLLAAAQSNPHLRLIIVDQEADKKENGETSSRYWPKFFSLGSRGVAPVSWTHILY